MSRITVALAVVVTALAVTRASSTVLPNITWTLQNIQQYNPSNPYLVTLGTQLKVLCLNTSIAIYSLTDIQQYDECNCVISPNLTCVANQRSVCVQNSFIILTFGRNSVSLPDVFDYFPGETYYFASFLSGTSGEPCLPVGDEPGLRMAVRVLASGEEGTTTDSPIVTTGPSSTSTPASPTTEVSVVQPSGLGASVSKGLPVWEIIAAVIGCLVLIILMIYAVIVSVIVGVYYKRKRDLASSESVEEGDGLSAAFEETDSSRPKPVDPDFKADLSLPMPAKPAFKPSSQLTRSLNNYEDIKFIVRGSTAIADSGKEKSAAEKETEEECVEIEKEGASGNGQLEINKNRIELNKEAESEPDNEKDLHLTQEDASNLNSASAVLRLASIDETMSLSKDLINLQTPTSTTQYSTNRQFIWEPKDSLSSITSFTTLAVTRVNEAKGDDAELSDENQLFGDTRKTAKPLFESGKSTMVPSSSLDDVSCTVGNEEKTKPNANSVILICPKPKPRPRIAKKSESNTKEPGVTLDPLSSSSKRKSVLVRTASLDADLCVVDSEGKPEHAEVSIEAATLSRPKPKPKPRVARKSESSAKGEEVKLGPHTAESTGAT